MTAELPVKTSRPKKSFSSITQIGLKALGLATTYKDAIEARLPGAIESLAGNLDALGVVVPDALQTRHEAIAATAAQNAMIQKGYARVQAVRETVRSSGAPREVRRAYGIGQKTAGHRARDVKAALQQIIDRAKDAPEEAAMFGIIAEDVAAMTAFVAALTNTRQAQEKKRADAPLTTQERNRTGNQIILTVTLISGAGRIAFADNPEVCARFEALTARPRKSARKPKAEAEPAKAAEPVTATEPAKAAEAATTA